MPGSEKGGFFRQNPAYKVDWYRYLAFMPAPGPAWKASDFNWDADYKRLRVMHADDPVLHRQVGEDPGAGSAAAAELAGNLHHHADRHLVAAVR